MSFTEIAVLTFCAAAAGAVNALAGGGMLVAYPVLVAFGLSPIAGNATATVALLAGGIGAQLGYRKEMKGTAPYLKGLVLPCIAGGILGAFLLLKTPPRQFAAMVPGLVLLATFLFAAQGPITRLALQVHARITGTELATPKSVVVPTVPTVTLLGIQLLISIYIGYFGAGAGAIMLANFGFAGLVNIHQMNGLKLWCGMLTNVTAAVVFALQPGLVHWQMVAVMTCGSVVGGYGSSRVAQRVSDKSVRLTIVAIGVAMAAWLTVSALSSRSGH
ncbi:MAG: sulfite exporter TauE/SafE family protein [Gemmatimonadaceae bacterium]